MHDEKDNVSDIVCGCGDRLFRAVARLDRRLGPRLYRRWSSPYLAAEPGWEPDIKVEDILKEYNRYFISGRYEEKFAEGLMIDD